MELAELLDPPRVAALVVDMQNDFVHPNGKVARAGADVGALWPVVEAINRLIAAARGVGAAVVYVRVEHGPEVDRPPYRARYAKRGMDPNDVLCHTGSWGARLLDELLPPTEHEPVFVKHGYDAFQAPALEPHLRRAGIETVLVTGVVTNLCVMATAASAFERGFYVVVPRDCTAGTDAESAGHALRSVEHWYGEVASLDEVLRLWAGVAPRSSTG